MSNQITYDSTYAVVDPTDFRRMIEVDRYGRRSDAFDAIISATHDHFWDPLDPAYVDFSIPFDATAEYMMPPERMQEFRAPVVQELDQERKFGLSSRITHWLLSSILHGEQAALSLSAGLCSLLMDPGAQEYAANQAREEARHVTAFARYIEVRWGEPLEIGQVLGDLLTDLVTTEVVWKKLVGMQMLLEGLAMGAFANLHANTNDPVLRRLVQLVMTDEAFHHKFGKIWAERTMPHMTAAERDEIEDWAAEVFEVLLFNLVNIRQKQVIYPEFGLDWEEVREGVREVYDDADRRNELKEGTNVFRVLTKTLLKAGIITERTRGLYAGWVDMAELEAEGEVMVGDAIAADGIEFLRAINKNRRAIASKSAVA
ncbi:MAG: ferritin-like domain-containing protein [Alphaproteobacteria bacterium]|jgi:hypothetical protein|nr:ferritin-like domain-containing protein [Alphaproteobacteria bacterium]